MNTFEFTVEEKSQLERVGTAAVILFGSHAQGVQGPMSDVDIGVLLNNARAANDPQQRGHLYDALYDILSPVVARVVKRLCDIDIVFLQNEEVSLQLKYHVAKYGTELFKKDPRAFADFKEYVMERYMDFAPLRRMFTEAILARV